MGVPRFFKAGCCHSDPRGCVNQDRLTLRLTNRISEIPRSAELVEAFCDRHELTSKISFAINVSLEELLANTMSYGYADDRDHEIVVEIRRDDPDLVIDIADDARPFDPTQVAPPDLHGSLKERAIGGLGIHLVRNMMDEMEYRYDGKQNLVRLRKRIAPPVAS
jgi:anti-sigma regulatory factor (Ser/Thr protein kinase)